MKVPVYECRIAGEGNTKYRTLAEINNNNYTALDLNDPFWFTLSSINFETVAEVIRDETHFFSVYKYLRNPIVKLTLIQD